MPSTTDSQLDAQLVAFLPDSGITVHLCSAAPADYAGIAAVDLGKKAITDSFLHTDANPDGRMTTIPAQTGIPITGASSATAISHIVYSNDSDTLYFVTEATDSPLKQAVNGETKGCGAVTIRVADPIAA